MRTLAGHTKEVNVFVTWLDRLRLISVVDDASTPLRVIATGNHHHWTPPRDLCGGKAGKFSTECCGIIRSGLWVVGGVADRNGV